MHLRMVDKLVAMNSNMLVLKHAQSVLEDDQEQAKAERAVLIFRCDTLESALRNSITK